MAKKTASIKHPSDKRVHIPSKEEAGYEEANPKVQKGKKELELPKNPVVHRGQDPELFWLNKYGNDDRDDLLRVDIRSLYRHEHIAPETLIENLYKVTEEKSAQGSLFNVNELFGNALEKDELEKVSDYYEHQDGWTNRLIQGDSHLVMTSLLEREGMAGQVQMIFFDPPYGIKYGSNWQIKLNNKEVKDGNDESLTGEPEQIKAFRDTWEKGIHSYLSYLRDRLLIARELLLESGSCFVQISDENVHLVRNIMDEVFGSANFINQISFKKTPGLANNSLAATVDYILWYSKNKESVKFRELFREKKPGEQGAQSFTWIESPDGTIQRKLSKEEQFDLSSIPKGWRIFAPTNPTSYGFATTTNFDFDYNGVIFRPPSADRRWRTTRDGMNRLVKLNRFLPQGKMLWYKNYLDDFPLGSYTNYWEDTAITAFSSEKKFYVVQTSSKVIQRCMLMCTDPGDLVIDPTCGSGTTAFVAEQF